MKAIWVAAMVISLLLIVYSYLIYPVIIRLAVRWLDRTSSTDSSQLRSGEQPPSAEQSRSGDAWPSVTVVIAAHNAGLHVRRRVENLRACDYPSDRLTILIASDGSSDSTVAQVRQWADPRVQVIDFPVRRGKAATLCEAVGRVRSDVVLFTDVTTHFGADAIQRLMRHFRRPQIGLAIGRIVMVDSQGRESEGLYWRRETALRRWEARLGIVLGASGAIYAMRRDCFVAPRKPIINDDLVFPMLARLTHGCEVIFDETARAYAATTGGIATEFRRRCRIGSGGWQSLAVLGQLLEPRHWGHALAFLSHKLLRWAGPLALLVCLAANLALLGEPPFDLLFTLQVQAYALAGIGLVAPADHRLARLPRLAASFCSMNLALLVGFVRWAVGADDVVWKPTPRPSHAMTVRSQPAPAPKFSSRGRWAGPRVG